MALRLQKLTQFSRCWSSPAILCSNGYSTQIATYKRGKGGRSSFSGKVVTVLGATGFMGRYVVNELGKTGCQVVIPYRGDPYATRELKVMGDLGQVLFLPYDLRDENSLQRVMKYSNVVVNLIGRDWETKMYKYGDVHKTAARDIARMAKLCGVEKFIHMSAMNCAQALQTHYIPGGSRFLRSKWFGEQEVRREFPDATIFRPADVYGQEDRFLNYYSSMFRRTILGNVPLYKRGVDTIKMPIYVNDVARAVMIAINNRDTDGNTYELVGPEAFVLKDLVEYIYRCLRYNPVPMITYVNSIFQLRMHLLSYWPSVPPGTLDRLDRETNSDVLTGELTSTDLGLTNMTKISERCEWELAPKRKLAYLRESVGEFPVPEPPKSIFV